MIEKFRQHKRKIFWTGIGIATIILILIIFVGALKVNFLIGEELRVSASPEYSVINTISPGNASIDIVIDVYNKVVCKAECAYVLEDISYNQIIDNGTFTSRGYATRHYALQILLPYHGYGQNLYTYTIRCNNVHSTFCPSSNITIQRRGLVIVNYTPSEEAIAAQNYAFSIFPDILSNAELSWANMLYIDNATKSLESSIKLQDATMLRSTQDYLISDIRSVSRAWDDGDYLTAKSVVDDRLLLSRSEMLLADTEAYISSLEENVSVHNKLITDINALVDGANSYNLLYSYNQLVRNFTNISITEPISADMLSLRNDLNAPDAKDSHMLGQLSSRASILNNTIQSMDIDALAITSAAYSIITPVIYYYSGMDCTMNNKCRNISGTGSIGSVRNINDATLLLDRACNDTFGIYADLYTVKSSTNASANASINFTEPANSSLWADFMTIRDSCTSSIIAKKNIVPIDHSKHNVDMLLSRNFINASYIDMPRLAVPAPKCCVYGVCGVCSTAKDISPSSNASNYPLLLLHGHSFNKDTSAYQSIEIFDDFEDALVKNMSYYDIGTLTNGVNLLTPGVLKGYDANALVKPTYYITTYNDILGLQSADAKTGNIDTYALRLKEIIDNTKQITGKNKVDIVAHSMGGLVVRRYMQVFGSDDINKLVLIGSPNNGITGSTYTFCRIFGTSNECEDMDANGVFIKKLNDQIQQAVLPDTYLVVGAGCDTNKEYGDGVVTINSSLMDYFSKRIPKDHVLFVNGTCTSTQYLHNELLDTKKYPQVYGFVKDVLEGNIRGNITK